VHLGPNITRLASSATACNADHGAKISAEPYSHALILFVHVNLSARDIFVVVEYGPKEYKTSIDGCKALHSVLTTLTQNYK
jgi:hypothetical protein